MALNFPLGQLGSRVSFAAFAGFLARAQNRYYAKHFAQPRYVWCNRQPYTTRERGGWGFSWTTLRTQLTSPPPPPHARLLTRSVMPLFHGALLTFCVGYGHHYQHLSTSSRACALLLLPPPTFEGGNPSRTRSCQAAPPALLRAHARRAAEWALCAALNGSCMRPTWGCVPLPLLRTASPTAHCSPRPTPPFLSPQSTTSVASSTKRMSSGLIQILASRSCTRVHD